MSATSLQAKLGYVDSEKSPALQMANIKASLALARQVTFIERSERLVAGRILSDQKVLFRRFQAKLAQSRLEDARRAGDKGKARDLLRARGLGAGLHTDVGLRAEAEGRELQAALRQVAARSCSSRGPRRARHGGESNRPAPPKSAPAGVGRRNAGIRSGNSNDPDRDESISPDDQGREVVANEGGKAGRSGVDRNSRRPRPVTAFVTRMPSARGQDSPPAATRRLRSAGGSLSSTRGRSCSLQEDSQVRATQYDNAEQTGDLGDHHNLDGGKQAGRGRARAAVAWIGSDADGRGKVNDETGPVTSMTNSSPPPSSAPSSPDTPATPASSRGKLRGPLTARDEAACPHSFSSSSWVDLDAIDQVLKAQQQQGEKQEERQAESGRRPPRRPETAPVSVHFSTGAPAAGASATAAAAPSAGRKAKQARQNKRPVRASIFAEEVGPTLLDIHRLHIRRQDYDDKVRRFCETIRPFRAGADNVTDYYYSLRMAENKTAKGERNGPSTVSETCPTEGPGEDREEENGRVKMRSLTLKTLTY